MDMSGKDFRVAPAGQRTNTEGKQVSNRVLLATPDNEYELMRPDLTYIDLPHHLSLHEPTQKIEFVYFPNRGMVSQVVVTKDGRTVEVGVVGSRRTAKKGNHRIRARGSEGCEPQETRKIRLRVLRCHSPVRG